MELNQIINLETYPIFDPQFRATCRAKFEASGVLTMPEFVTKSAIKSIREEGIVNRDKVYASTEQHTVYLSPVDPDFSGSHPRNLIQRLHNG